MAEKVITYYGVCSICGFEYPGDTKEVVKADMTNHLSIHVGIALNEIMVKVRADPAYTKEVSSLTSFLEEAERQHRPGLMRWATVNGSEDYPGTSAVFTVLGSDLQ